MSWHDYRKALVERGMDGEVQEAPPRWYLKNFLKKWWIDPDLDEFNKEFYARYSPSRDSQ